MATTVDGLVSGMSTSTMISQLMQIEAAPQTRLKTKVSDAQSVVTAYQSVNTKISALKTAADSLGQLGVFLIFILVLLARPTGLFGAKA